MIMKMKEIGRVQGREGKERRKAIGRHSRRQDVLQNIIVTSFKISNSSTDNSTILPT